MGILATIHPNRRPPPQAKARPARDPKQAETMDAMARGFQAVIDNRGQEIDKATAKAKAAGLLVTETKAELAKALQEAAAARDALRKERESADRLRDKLTAAQAQLERGLAELPGAKIDPAALQQIKDQVAASHAAVLEAIASKPAPTVSTVKLEERLNALIMRLAKAPQPPKPPTYRMRVTGHDANGRPSDVVLAPTGD